PGGPGPLLPRLDPAGHPDDSAGGNPADDPRRLADHRAARPADQRLCLHRPRDARHHARAWLGGCAQHPRPARRAAGRAAPLLSCAVHPNRRAPHHAATRGALPERDHSCLVSQPPPTQKGPPVPSKSGAPPGILAAVTTPFTADASAVDEAALTAQAEWLIGSGIHGLVPCGTTGGFPTLTPDEHRRVIELYVKAAAGRVPVIAGVGALSTAGAIALAQDAERLGADAVMVVPPFYDPLDFATLTTFLRAVAESISLPIVYYNVPGATGIRLDADQIAELGEIDGVDYLKDTSGDAVTLTDLLVSRTDKIKAFNGWDPLTFIGIASGAEASVWGAAGVVPELAVRLWDTLAVKGDLAEAREQWRHLWAISDFLASVNYVAGVKAGLELVGHPAGPPRAPIHPLSVEQRRAFAAILERAGVAVVGA